MDPGYAFRFRGYRGRERERETERERERHRESRGDRAREERVESASLSNGSAY